MFRPAKVGVDSTRCLRIGEMVAHERHHEAFQRVTRGVLEEDEINSAVSKSEGFRMES